MNKAETVSEQRWKTCSHCFQTNAYEDEYCNLCGELLVEALECSMCSIEIFSADKDGLCAACASEKRAYYPIDESTDIFMGHYPHGTDTYIETVTKNLPDLPDLAVTETWCLNCDMGQKDCGCQEDYLPLEIVQVQMWDDGIEIYETGSKCENCVFVHSHECGPMREWLGKWVHSGGNETKGKSSKKLSGCEEYRSI